MGCFLTGIVHNLLQCLMSLKLLHSLDDIRLVNSIGIVPLKATFRSGWSRGVWVRSAIVGVRRTRTTAASWGRAWRLGRCWGRWLCVWRRSWTLLTVRRPPGWNLIIRSRMLAGLRMRVIVCWWIAWRPVVVRRTIARSSTVICGRISLLSVHWNKGTTQWKKCFN